MKNKLTLLLVLLTGILIGQIMLGTARALYEESGSWSAAEKRQVINYLEQIAKNTRR